MVQWWFKSLNTWSLFDFDHILVFHSFSAALPRCTHLEPGHRPFAQLTGIRPMLCPWGATVRMERNKRESWPMLRFRNWRVKLMNAWPVPKSLRRALSPKVLRGKKLNRTRSFLSQRFPEGGLLRGQLLRPCWPAWLLLLLPRPPRPNLGAKARIRKPRPRRRWNRTQSVELPRRLVSALPLWNHVFEFSWCSLIRQNQFSCSKK